MDDQELNALFAEWAQWCRSKCLYAPSPNPKSIIGTLRMPAGRSERSDRPLDAELARLHLAILASGERGDLIVAHYLLRPYYKFNAGRDTRGNDIWRRRRTKEMAHAVGIAPESWHRSVRRACRDAYSRMTAIERAESTTEEVAI